MLEVGIEPTTRKFSVSRSAIELSKHAVVQALVFFVKPLEQALRGDLNPAAYP